MSRLTHISLVVDTLLLRLSLHEPDEDITPSVTRTTNIPPPTAVIQGPLTRARARELNYQVNSFLAVHTNVSKDWMLLTYCDDFIILRNLREDP